MLYRFNIFLYLLLFTSLTFSQISDSIQQKIHFVAQTGFGFALWHPPSADVNTVRQTAYNYKLAAGFEYDFNNNWRGAVMIEYNRMSYTHTVFINGISNGTGMTQIQPQHALNQIGIQIGISRDIIQRSKSNLRIGIAFTPTFNIDRSVTDKIMGTVALDSITSDRFFFFADRQDRSRFFFTKTAYIQQTYKLGKTELGIRLEFNLFDTGLYEYRLEFDISPKYESYYNAGGPFLNTNIFFLF